MTGKNVSRIIKNTVAYHNEVYIKVPTPQRTEIKYLSARNLGAAHRHAAGVADFDVARDKTATKVGAPLTGAMRV